MPAPVDELVNGTLIPVPLQVVGDNAVPLVMLTLGSTVTVAVTGVPAQPTVLVVNVGVIVYTAVSSPVPALVRVAANGLDEVQPAEHVTSAP